jgi:hypothetical protein
MNDEINQLIRMAQVLRVRSTNLTTSLARLPKAPKDVVQGVFDVGELCREVEAKLKRAFDAIN